RLERRDAGRGQYRRRLAGDPTLFCAPGQSERAHHAMTQLADYAAHIDNLARKLGLSYYGVDFELVPERFMLETAVYGLPVRLPLHRRSKTTIPSVVAGATCQVKLRPNPWTALSPARRRRNRNTTCCGSLLSTVPISRAGSATCSSRCAKNRSTSIPSSPVRS